MLIRGKGPRSVPCCEGYDNRLVGVAPRSFTGSPRGAARGVWLHKAKPSWEVSGDCEGYTVTQAVAQEPLCTVCSGLAGARDEPRIAFILVDGIVSRR